jgi:hypothetical protein
VPIPRNIRDLPGYGGRTQGRPARRSRRPAGGARTHRDGPGGEPGIPSLTRRPREVPMAPPRTRERLSPHPTFMGLGGLVPRMQGGGGLSRGQQDMLRQAQELSATSGQNPAQLQRLTAQHGNLYNQGQQRRARRQMAGNQPGRSAMRGIGPGMAYGGVPRLALGSQVPGPGGPPGGLPKSPMGPGMAPPGIPSGPPPMGSPPNRLDALRGAGPGGPPPMAGGPPPVPMGNGTIEEEGGSEGLSIAIADTLINNTAGVDEALAVLDEARDEVLAIAGEEDIAMADEGTMMEDEGMGALEGLLG